MRKANTMGMLFIKLEDPNDISRQASVGTAERPTDLGTRVKMRLTAGHQPFESVRAGLADNE